MFVGTPADAASVINPNNYALTAGTQAATVRGVDYDSATHTVLLHVEGLTPADYTLTVRQAIQGTNGFDLAAPYQVTFTAVSDFSPYVDIQFTDSRLDRLEQTITYEVTVTNRAPFDLLLPLLLVLDPVQDVGGPRAADGRTADGRWLIRLDPNVPGGVMLGQGQSTIGHTVRVVTPDFRKTDYLAGVLAVPTANQAPRFTNDPPPDVNAGPTYRYATQATDPDGSVVAYLLQRAPQGMTVNATSGEVLWVTSAQSPEYAAVVLYVFDSRGGYTPKEWTVHVVGGNRAPQMNPLPARVEVREGEAWRLPVVAGDPDNDPLAFRVEGLPPWAVFTPDTHTLFLSPDHGTAGTYPGVTFFVSDGVNTVSQSVDILIAAADQPPTLTVPGPRTLREGDTFVTYFDGSDPDGQPVTFSSTALPPGAVLDPGTGRFEWTPAFNQAWPYQLPIPATAGGLSVTRTATFNVLNANAAPVFAPQTEWTVFEGQELTFRTFALDPDHPDFVLPAPAGAVSPVTYVATGLPPGASYDAPTATFHWTPGYTQAGRYTFTVTATDDGNGTGTPLSSQLTVTITVRNLNRPPVIAPVANVRI